MKSKVIFSDNGRDKAIIGQIVKEDDFFLELESQGLNYRIGKRSIVCVKESKECEENERYSDNQ